MDIKAFTLIAVELTQSIRTVSIPDNGVNNWECKPNWKIGHNDEGQVIQNIELELIRRKNTKQATIKAMTSFLLKLGTQEYQPTTEKDFQVYTFFATLAMSHARTFFIREAIGSSFAGDILPADHTDGIRQKLVLAVSINPN